MKLALVGYGRMGQAVEAEALSAGHEILARLGRTDLNAGVESLSDALAGADIAVDFSVGEQVADTVVAAERAGVDLVVGTTDLDERAIEAFADVSDIGVVHGPNFSIGVHMFFRLIREAATLANGEGRYDVHIHEMHHRHKRDHPSGTAVRAADILLQELDRKANWKEGPPPELADPGTLYVSSSRAGEIPGTHIVALEGAHDRIEIRHEARDRRGFAQGSVRAAEWVRGRKGVFEFSYVMNDLLGDAHRRQ